MKIIERKPEGATMPPYHGIAYIEYCSNHTVTAIVPLNWIISIGRATWAFIRFGNREIASSPREAYLQGVRASKRKEK